MNNRNKIDDLFREGLSGYRAEPSLGLWLRLERRFFPPSKHRPSGLITSILLLMVAGLMPWILIPASDNKEQEPNIQLTANTRSGYLIQSASPEVLAANRRSAGSLATGAYTIKPVVYQENPQSPETDPATQLIASINDPALDPAIQPLLQAFQNRQAREKAHDPSSIAYSAVHWVYRMRSQSAVLSYENLNNNELSTRQESIPGSAFEPGYENDYFKDGEFSAGLNFNPSIIFYDPNPYNKIIGGEAVVHYKISSFSIMSGLGYSRVEDIGSYKVNYVSNDSVGFYLRVVSFIPDPRNPGEVTYVVIQEPIYDSVPHYAIEDKTNYYSYIDIPLSFGYTFLQKNRVSLSVSAGIKFSFLVGKNEPKVDFWLPDAELLEIEREIPARTNTNWRFTAGVDFGYLFTRNFSLHLEPVFEQYISPIYVEQPGFDPTRPYIVGVKAGIRYNF